MIVVSLDIFWTMFQLTGGERLRERHVHHIVLEVGYRYPRGAGAAGGDMDCMKASSSSDCASRRGLRPSFFCRTATIMDVFLSYSRFSYRADVVHIRREMSTIMTGGGLRERSFENDFGPAFPLNHR